MGEDKLETEALELSVNVSVGLVLEDEIGPGS
jgi:hypothetical protein